MMDHQQNSSIVRVSVLFERSAKNLPVAPRGAARYEQNMYSARERKNQFVQWLHDNHIDYSHLSDINAFNTLFIDVPSAVVPTLSHAPGVADVVIDQEMGVNLLGKKAK